MSMEFLPRLFDSFSRERIPCEKQKNKRHHLAVVSLVCVFRRCRIVCPCRAVVHTTSVVRYGSDEITGRCSG